MTARLIVYFSLTFFNIPDRSIPTDQILVAVWILLKMSCSVYDTDNKL